jgi:hypothetical protein
MGKEPWPTVVDRTLDLTIVWPSSNLFAPSPDKSTLKLHRFPHSRTDGLSFDGTFSPGSTLSPGWLLTPIPILSAGGEQCFSTTLLSAK